MAGSDPDGEKQEAQAALAELCRVYWKPVFSFVCRQGWATADAQDLTQDFFVMILKNNWLQHADESRGRFRSFLLKSLQNFLYHADERKHAHKRGGTVEVLSWDAWMAEPPAESALGHLPAERVFDLRWAMTVVEHALRRLAEECEANGRRQVFDVLRNHLTAERGETSYGDLALQLGVAEAVIKKQLHNLRQRYRWLLRSEVAETVEDPADVDAEIRYLCATLVHVAD